MPQWDLANADCVLVMGSNMAENHPIAFRFVMQAKEQAARRSSTSIRASRAPRRWPTSTRRCAPAATSPSSAASSATSSRTTCGSRSTRSATPTSRRSSTRASRTRASSTACSPAGTKKSHKYDYDSWQYEGQTVPSLAGRAPRQHHRALQRASTQRMTKDQPPDDRHAAASALRLPDPAAPLRAVHAGDGRARHRLPARDLPQGRRGDRPQLRAASAPARSATRSAGPITRPACR